jgi:hypothetical protein
VRECEYEKREEQAREEERRGDWGDWFGWE